MPLTHASAKPPLGSMSRNKAFRSLLQGDTELIEATRRSVKIDMSGFKTRGRKSTQAIQDQIERIADRYSTRLNLTGLTRHERKLFKEFQEADGGIDILIKPYSKDKFIKTWGDWRGQVDPRTGTKSLRILLGEIDSMICIDGKTMSIPRLPYYDIFTHEGSHMLDDLAGYWTGDNRWLLVDLMKKGYRQPQYESIMQTVAAYNEIRANMRALGNWSDAYAITNIYYDGVPDLGMLNADPLSFRQLARKVQRLGNQLSY